MKNRDRHFEDMKFLSYMETITEFWKEVAKLRRRHRRKRIVAAPHVDRLPIQENFRVADTGKHYNSSRISCYACEMRLVLMSMSGDVLQHVCHRKRMGC